MEKIRLTRKSIYDPKLKVVGYELAFHAPAWEEGSEGLTPEQFAALYVEEKLETIAGTGTFFVNFSQAMLNEAPPSVLAKEKLVILLDEVALTVDAALLARIAELKSAGFKMAASGALLLTELGDLAQRMDYFKINTHNTTPEALQERVQALKAFPGKIIAAEVADHAMFKACQAAGVVLFQGNFLSLPNLENKQKVSTNKVATLRLLSALDDPDIGAQEVEELLSHDSRLSYKLLRVVNSAAFSFPREISSLREAIVFLGLRQIREWAGMIVLSSVEEKPSDLMRITLTRAKMCELIAEKVNSEENKSFFTVGLFSTLDALLDKPMGDILQDLPLSDNFKEALLSQEGPYGRVLANVIHYEQGNWRSFDNCGVDDNTWMQIYLESVQWAGSALGMMR